VTTLLVIDVGNTNTSLGLFDYAPREDGRGESCALSQHWRIGTHREQTSDEVALTILGLFGQTGRRASEVTHVIISSVVPPLLPIFERVSTKLFQRPPLIVGPGIRTGMPIRYENPREVGADRIVNALAAYELLGGPVIAVDFGTATTFDCVSADGEYLGGVIFPGIHTAMEALFARASMLHRVEIVRPKSVIGKTTTGALQSGLLYGYAGVVDSMVQRIRGELGVDAPVVATGGLAGRVANESAVIDRVEPFLTLEGLRIIFDKNRSVWRSEAERSRDASRPEGGAQRAEAERSRENPHPSAKEK
jgi:type III pantothenate kinase